MPDKWLDMGSEHMKSMGYIILHVHMCQSFSFSILNSNRYNNEANSPNKEESIILGNYKTHFSVSFYLKKELINFKLVIIVSWRSHVF